MHVGAKIRSILAGSAALLLGACVSVPSAPPPPSLDMIESRLAQDIATLADDSFGGRFPGTYGEEKTRSWLIDRYTQIGLEPGAGDGDWTQDFTLVRRSARPEASASRATVTRGGRTLSFSEGVIGSHAGVDNPTFADVPMVGVDPDLEELKANSLVNRALVMPAADLFKRASQLEKAEPKIVVVTTADQQTYDQISQFVARGRWRLESDTEAPATLLLSPENSTSLMQLIGKNTENHADGLGVIGYDTVLQGSITQDVSRLETANVIGRLPGQVEDAGALIVLAHWDPLGDECRPADAPDRLCNGAVDNASGLAVMTEAVRLAASEGPMDRDLIVLATSAEELGLLGAEAFVADPPVPLPTIVAGFNIDTVAIAPRGAPVVILGAGETPLDYGITEVARTLGREVVPTELQDQFIRRQDGWVFLREGVSTVMAGSTLADEEVFQAFLKGPYHGPGDEVGPNLELGGAAEDTLLHAALIRYFGSTTTYPGLGGN